MSTALALRTRRLGTSWAVALVAGALAFQLAGFAARALPPAPPFGELAYYPSGHFLRPATLGQAPLVADLAWLRAVQYYGEHRRGDNRFDRMYHVFDILTTLAPHFQAAYVFGGFALAQEGFDFPRAERLMLKGIEQNPRSGWLAFEMGFLYYVRPGGRDLHSAAEYFSRASYLPGAPASAPLFAAYARQNTGNLGVARALWVTVRDESRGNPYLRDIAVREIHRIDDALRHGDARRAENRLTTPVVLIGDGESEGGPAK